jgi:hypothetical protein
MDEILESFKIGSAGLLVIASLADDNSVSWNCLRAEVRYRFDNGFNTFMRLNKAKACEDMPLMVNAKFRAKRLARLTG